MSANMRLENHGDGRVTLWLDMADRSVNVFSRQILADLGAALDQLVADPAPQVVVLRSAKPSGFIAGADLHEFTEVRSPADAMLLSGHGQQLFDRLAKLPIPTVAVIHGPCLGGGLEFALACDYRLAIDHPKTQLGLPELELGLLPGWGGTQRLPRVIGLEPALRMILGTRRLKAAEALRWGLADGLATEAGIDGALAELIARARIQGKRPKDRLPLRTWRQRLLESNRLGRYLIFRGAERALRQRVPEDMPAPAEALRAVRVGVTRGTAAGFAAEREAIGRLAMTSACHNLVNLFFQRERSRQLPAALRSGPVRRVGIVGAGTMGAGIAQLAAVKGFEVVVQEVNASALDAGMRKIDELFRKAVEHRVLSPDDAARQLAAIGRTTKWHGFDQADLVIEAVVEDLGLKREVFAELERRTRPTTVLATNTSSLLVEHLQEGRERPGRIGGLHFFHPVHKMPLVEVVRAPATDPATAATLMQFAIDLGKVPVLVKDSPGFLVNRVLMPYLNEAVLLLGESRLTVRQLDRSMRTFGMPVGPFELLDQVGLDVAAHIEESMQPAFGERFQPNPAFARMCELRWLGQKSGTGFYRYFGEKKKENLEVFAELPGDLKAKRVNLEIGDGPLLGEARDRMVLLMVNEAAACLGEELVNDPDTIDLALVFGTGWAPHRGGPLHYADSRGLGEVVRRLAELARRHGPRFEPCAELRRRAENAETFFSTDPFSRDPQGGAYERSPAGHG